MKRREFISGIFAMGGLWAIEGLEAAERVFGPRRLAFGVVSDVHVRDGAPRDHSTSGDTFYFKKTMTYFKARKVDAVMIAGDLADRGRDTELLSIAKAWFEVFPEGCGVEKLFVCGNHDWWGQRAQVKMKALWEKAWREPYASFWHKTVKGYDFFGKHWDSDKPQWTELGAWLATNGACVRGPKPFFYVQHPHPRDTCNGTYAWGRDNGNVTKTLAAYPNAVTFSGHSHHAQTDERSIWQGAFTSVNTGSLRYGCHPDDGGLPGRGYENGVRGDDKLMPSANVNETKTGLLVEVFDTAIVYHRRDFQNDCALGPDWVQPLPASATPSAMGFAERAAKETPPAFAPGAAITVKETTRKPRKGAAVPALEIRFPAATANATRPYTYELRFTGNDAKQAVTRGVVAEGFDQARAHPWTKRESCAVIAASALPSGGWHTLEVTPISSLGVRGKPLALKRS